MLKQSMLALVALALLVLAGVPPAAQPTVFLVRHAERADSSPARARRWAPIRTCRRRPRPRGVAGDDA